MSVYRKAINVLNHCFQKYWGSNPDFLDYTTSGKIFFHLILTEFLYLIYYFRLHTSNTRDHFITKISITHWNKILKVTESDTFVFAIRQESIAEETDKHYDTHSSLLYIYINNFSNLSVYLDYMFVKLVFHLYFIILVTYLLMSFSFVVIAGDKGLKFYIVLHASG